MKHKDYLCLLDKIECDVDCNELEKIHNNFLNCINDYKIDFHKIIKGVIIHGNSEIESKEKQISSLIHKHVVEIESIHISITEKMNTFVINFSFTVFNDSGSFFYTLEV